VAFEDGFTASPRPAFIQRICAVREAPLARGGSTGVGSTVPPRYDLAV